jgi:DNA-binding Lrp family transcriptional regulator
MIYGPYPIIAKVEAETLDELKEIVMRRMREVEGIMESEAAVVAK